MTFNLDLITNGWAAPFVVFPSIPGKRVLTQHWRQGAMLIGGALLVAAVYRAVVPDDRIGLLAVRSRPVDVLCYSCSPR